MAHFLFFARIREQLGQGSLQLTLPPDVTRVAQVLVLLQARGEPFTTVLQDRSLQVAVNQRHAKPDDAVCDGDEIALFPPVSGG
ncbi:MAG: molybdopterin converting factor subunit 1 [Magnetococcales bacterium]|nr:molybdopterin converting factor subunit 1 [Magnetococcales bacterium]